MPSGASRNARPMQSLAEHLAEITSASCIEFCAARADIPPDRVRRRLVDYVGEVAVGAALLSPLSLAGRRVLEVGAGLGLLGIWLRRRGVSVTMLEPGAGGFSENERLLGALLEWTKTSGTDVIRSPAESLDPLRHGTFDIVFSVNVLEHIPHLEDALRGILSVLEPGGVMRHTCANYTVPYEPHYGWPLIPFFPRATGYLVPRVRQDEVWRSLNFITYGRVVRFCRTHAMAYDFDRGTMAKAFSRLEEDPAFRARHGAVVAIAHNVLRSTGVLKLLARVPPIAATPMAFSCWRSGEQPHALVRA